MSPLLIFQGAGWERVEEEAGAAGDVPGVAGGIFAAGIFEAGGVLDDEAVVVEIVGLDDFLIGETEAFVAGILVLGADVLEFANGGAEGGGVLGNPAFGLEFGGVFERGGYQEWSMGGGKAGHLH